MAVSQPLDAIHGGIHVGAAVEGRQAEIALASGPEPAARGAHHVRFVQQVIEEAPGVHAVRRLDPHVGRMFPAVDGQSGAAELLADDRGAFTSA